ADLVYCNDVASTPPAAAARLRGRPFHAKTIFNVLDLAPHLGAAFPLVETGAILKTHVDAVTTISHTVARDLKARLDIDASVIYMPTRAITRLPEGRRHGALFVGRVGDAAKRASIGASALAILGFGWIDVLTVGRESPLYGGEYWGEVTDEALSRAYNEHT